MTISGFLFCLTAVMTGLNASVSMPPLDPRGKTLPNHARAVTTTAGWVSPYYVWRNKNTILIFRGDESYSILQGLDEYHLDTGKLASLNDLNRRWLDNPVSLPHTDRRERDGEKEGGAVAWATVSPNGKWIVWIAYRANVGGVPGHLMTISLDGKHWNERLTNPQIPDSVDRVAWARNSRSWIGLFDNFYVLDKPAGLVYDVYTQQVRRFDFSSQETLPKVQYKTWEIFAQRSNGHLFLKCHYPANCPSHNNAVVFADLPWQRESGRPKQWTIHLPPDTYAREVALSPSGDRLIWNLRFMPSGYDPDRLQPLSEAESKQFHNEIWLSNLDGSQMRRLGDLTFDTIHVYDDPENPGLIGLQWASDGKHISYIYDKVLYLVTVP